MCGCGGGDDTSSATSMLTCLCCFIPVLYFHLPESKPDLSLSIGTNGAASINVSVEVNGIVYSGESWESAVLALCFNSIRDLKKQTLDV